MENETDSKLTVEIQNVQPIELLDLTASLYSLGEEYKRFVASSELGVTGGLKLYIKEIRAGSIITDLVALAPLALPFIEQTKTIIEYGKHLKSVYDFYAGKKTDEKPNLDKTSLNHFSRIIEPVAKDTGSQFNIYAENGGVVNLTMNISSSEANAAQNSIRRELDFLKEPEVGLHNKVVLYWFQARGTLTNQAGDKGIIESISTNPVKVVFDSDKTKALLLLQAGENPFRSAYIVDVFVETINGKPALYKITNFHERIDITG